MPTGTEAERKIENFLVHNVEMIEPGMRLLRRQYPLKMILPKMIGKIDLMCVGCDGAWCPVELKAENLDSRNVGQMMSYYDIIANNGALSSLPPPRLYLIGPGFTPHFWHALNVIEGGAMINLTIKLYQTRAGTKLTDEEWEVDLFDHDASFKIRM